MGTITGNPASFSTITTKDDTQQDSAANRAVTYQALADQIAYTKAASLTDVPYLGSGQAYGTQVDQVGNASTFVGSTVLATTLSNVPAGTVLIVDAMVVAACSVPGAVRLEIVEGGTVTADDYTVQPVGSSDATFHLHGRFVKTGTGSATVRVAGKGGAGPYVLLKSPWNLRVQQARQS